MRHAAGITLVLAVLTAPVFGATSTETKVKQTGTAVENELRRYGHDAKGLAAAPFHWNRSEWARFGEGLGAVALVYAADPRLETLSQRNRSSFSDQFAKTVTPWGASRALEISALMIAGGAIAGDDQVRDAGRDSLESQIWAAGVVTPFLKRDFGRARPIQGDGARSFQPLSSRESFPSGHATNAWAFATAVAGHYDGWVVPTIVYTMAASVSMSRINDRAHFPSDVLAGALIGRAVGRSIVARHQHAHVAWTVTPTFLDRGMGVSVSLTTR